MKSILNIENKIRSWVFYKKLGFENKIKKTLNRSKELDISIAYPKSLRIEASSYCQLKCPACPTAQGEIHKSLLGSKFLKLETFQKILEGSDWVKEVELSNWGEIFLNPDLIKIMNFAYKRKIDLIANNGVNLNSIKDETIEALVKYQFKSMTCSIDGASQETYVQYRVRGNFDQVISNIKKINEYKLAYKSPYPKLIWQFVLFEHNKHELKVAENMARDLDMEFYTKVSWDPELAAKDVVN